MKYCMHCGAQLAEGSHFCAACGHKTAEEAAAAQKPVSPAPVLQSAPPAKRRPGLGILLILAAVAIVVAVILMAIAQYHR